MKRVDLIVLLLVFTTSMFAQQKRCFIVGISDYGKVNVENGRYPPIQNGDISRFCCNSLLRFYQ